MSAPMEALDDRSGSVFVVTLVLSIAATVFVALRLASKGLVVRKLTSDDYVTVLAWVFAVGLSVSIMLGAKRGLGAPDSAILPEWQDALKRTVYAFTVLYNPALMATKTAILILYVRMAAAHPFLRYASIATGVIVNLAGLILTLISVFQCRPVRAGYEDIDGECVDVVSLYLSSAPINILTDLAILALPLPILTRLRMEFKQKCALVATFVVGGFVTVVDVVRIIYLQNALREEREWSIYSTITLTTPPPNFTYHASFSLMWSAVEVNVGLMCACVLVLKPLIMRVMPGFLGGTISRSRRESRKERDTPESGSGQEKEQRPELSISVQQPTPVPEIYSPTAGVFGDRGLMIDLPGNNLCAIPERAQLADEDDGMDFFQMLASDPKCPAAGSLRKMSMSSHSTQSPATVHRARLSDAFTEISERDERDADGDEGSAQRDGRPDEDGSDDGMDFFQMLAADPPMTPATGSPVPLPTAVVAPRKRSLVRRATVSLARRVPGSLGTDRAPSPPPLPVQEPTQNFFDFVNMKSRTPLTQLSKKEAWWPIMFVSILFFLWGFAYGLLGTLNAQIQSLLHYSPGSTFALHNAYWIGYLIGPPVCGYWVLSKEGFKATFMTGLAIYATGAMSFWPSSVLKSYGGFFVSNVIIATGLSVLETAANPFIALAGPGELSEARLCFSQGIQGLGSIISPILAAKALFSGIDEEDLFRVQYCYLAVAILVVALAVVFFYVPLSEATDDELEAMATQRLYNAGLDKGEKAYRLDARQLVLWTGVIMMATYVGAQESVSYFWTPIIRTAQPDVDPFWMQAAGHCVFAFGRFAAAGLIYIRVTPRLIMFGCMIGCVITSAVAFASPPGDTPVAFLILALFFEAPLFPLIFAMSLRGQGKHTKFASTVVTMAISGGAIWPSVTYGVDMRHADARYAVRVTMGLYAAALLWPIILSASRKLRRWVDPKWSRIRVIEGGVVETGGSPGSGGMPSHADSHTHTHTHVIDWASPTMGKRDLTHVETSAAPDLGESVDSHEQRSNVHHLDHSDRAGQGRGSEEEKRNPLGNPLGISIPGGWRRNSGKDGRKRSVTWEKE